MPGPVSFIGGDIIFPRPATESKFFDEINIRE